LTTKHYICDLHFEPHFIVKSDNFLINGETVCFPRIQWKLTEDAVPTLFPNLPTYLSKHIVVRPLRKRAVIDTCNSFEQQKVQAVEHTVEHTGSGYDESGEYLSSCSVNRDHCYSAKRQATVSRSEMVHLRKKLRRNVVRISQLNLTIRKLRKENITLKSEVEKYSKLPQKTKTIISQYQQNVNAKSKTGHRYSDDWLLDSLLIRCKSAATYRLLRDGDYLPLPSFSTLSRCLQNLKPEFGFDSTLFDSLAKKLVSMNANERRGMLMFDEMQIQKNVDFRVDTCKMVGVVDFGELTTRDDSYTEGDHALVFLFQPHLGGWIQTVGSFCSSGTTPAIILAHLLLKCVILLENSGARVDGLVCDGASTNRSAISMLGYDGKLGSLQNKMKHPCDASRSIFFFCDMPHVLKTIRNNLLRAKKFQVLVVVLIALYTKLAFS